jgi:hypothetical protein
MSVETKPNKLTKGLVLDTFHTDVDNTVATYALNAQLEDQEGNHFHYGSEVGTTYIKNIPDNHVVIGHINMERNETLLFTTDGTNSNIGILSRKDDLTYEYIRQIDDSNQTTKLGFKKDTYIRGSYRLLNGCDKIIYFVDGINKDRRINLSQLKNYKLENGQWNIDELDLQRQIYVNAPNASVVNSGALAVGSYAVVIRIYDENLQLITQSDISQQVVLSGKQLVRKEAVLIQHFDTPLLNTDSSTGALNGEIFEEIDGGIISSKKGIKVTATSLPQDYPYAKIVIIAANVSNDKSAFELPALLSTNGIDYTITSLDGASRVDLDSVYVDPVIYDTSQHIEIVDKRLIRANVKTRYYDYSDFQSYANNVELKWISKPYVENESSFQSDEIYAFGIQYQMSDGSFSPVFHIPGRAATPNDRVVDTLSPTETDAIGTSFQRWQVYSTASIDGTLGYYESQETYPLTKKCNNEYVFGDLAGTPVRYHRMPMKNMIGMQNAIGINVNSKELPTNTIGWRVMVVERDSINRTVNDSGIITGVQESLYKEQRTVDYAVYGIASQVAAKPDAKTNRGYFRPSLTNSISNTVYATLCVKELVGEGIRTDYISIPCVFDLDGVDTQTVWYNQAEDKIILPNKEDKIKGDLFYKIKNEFLRIYVYPVIHAFTRLYNRNYNYSATSNNAIYQTVADTYYVNSYSKYEVGNEVYANQFQSNDVSFVKLKYPLNAPDIIANKSEQQLGYVLKKQATRPYASINSLQYKALTPTIYTTTDTVDYYNGDIYISRFRLTTFFLEDRDEAGFLGLGRDRELYTVEYTEVLLESDYNLNYRVLGTKQNEVFNGFNNVVYKNNSYFEGLANYFFNKIGELDEGDRESTKDDRLVRYGINKTKEYYAYNKDLNRLFMGKTYFPLPANWNYCEDCSAKFPNRIIWSAASFSEDKSDFFQTYLANNFTSVGTSPITALNYSSNRLLVRTTKSMFVMSPNPQEINTDVSTLYIGTGDFLSIPPQEIRKVDYGFGGGKGTKDFIATEFGFVTVDDRTGQVFLFSEGMKELTDINSGCNQWFKEYLPTITGHILLGYDPQFKRLMVYKRDEFDKTENKSFVISYSFNYQTWISFHSYHPKYFFNSFDTLFSTINSKLYSHDSRIYNEFYGMFKDSIFEYVINAPTTVDLDVIDYYAVTLDWDNDTKSWKNVNYPTFDRFMVYTKQQSTGLQELIPKSDYNIDWDNRKKTVSNRERNYRISAIRDLSTASPVMSRAWNDIESSFPIDAVATNVNYNASQWNQISIKDKYFYVRFFFNGKGTRIILDIMKSKQQLSIS